MSCKNNAENIAKAAGAGAGTPEDYLCLDPNEAFSMPYCIPAVNLDRLKKKLKQVERAARRAGIKPPEMRIVGESVLNVPLHAGTNVKGPVKHYDIILSGEVPSVGDWKFAGKLEHDPKTGNFVKDYSNLPRRFFDAAAQCEHCGQNRHRKHTYFLTNNAGEYRQVGSSCLKEFTGAMDPHAAASVAEFYSSLTANNSSWRILSVQNSDANYVSATEYLAWVMAAMREQGQFRSRSKTYGGHYVSTADYAISAMDAHRRNSNNVRAAMAPTDNERKEAQKIIDWVRTELEKKDADKGLTGFEYNLLQVVTPGERDDAHYLNRDHVGYAAYVPVYYDRQRERLRQQATLGASEWQGVIGERTAWRDLTLEAAIPYGTFGVGYYQKQTYLNKFRDPQGNVFTWVTDRALTPGAVYGGRATVKQHTEYNGVKQTQLTRSHFAEQN